MWSSYNSVKCVKWAGTPLQSSRYGTIIYKSLSEYSRSHCMKGGYSIVTTDDTSYDPMYFKETLCHECSAFNWTTHALDKGYIIRRQLSNN